MDKLDDVAEGYIYLEGHQVRRETTIGCYLGILPLSRVVVVVVVLTVDGGLCEDTLELSFELCEAWRQAIENQ